MKCLSIYEYLEVSENDGFLSSFKTMWRSAQGLPPLMEILCWNRVGMACLLALYSYCFPVTGATLVIYTATLFAVLGLCFQEFPKSMHMLTMVEPLKLSVPFTQYDQWNHSFWGSGQGMVLSSLDDSNLYLDFWTKILQFYAYVLTHWESKQGHSHHLHLLGSRRL